MTRGGVRPTRAGEDCHRRRHASRRSRAPAPRAGGPGRGAGPDGRPSGPPGPSSDLPAPCRQHGAWLAPPRAARLHLRALPPRWARAAPRPAPHHVRQPPPRAAAAPRRGRETSVQGRRRSVRRARRWARAPRSPARPPAWRSGAAGRGPRRPCTGRLMPTPHPAGSHEGRSGGALPTPELAAACLAPRSIGRSDGPSACQLSCKLLEHGVLGAGGCLLPACSPSLTVSVCIAPALRTRLAQAHTLTLGTAGTAGWAGAHEPSGGPARRPLQQGRLQAATGARRRLLPSVPARAARHGLLCARRCGPACGAPARGRPSGAPRLTRMSE